MPGTPRPHRRTLWKVIARVLPVLLLMFLSSAGRPVNAAVTLTVESDADDPDAVPGDGICASWAARCTLRAAIAEANALPGLQVISFSIGAGAQTIRPQSELPTITEPVTIDGRTQPGFAGTPLIAISGRFDQVNAAAGLTVTGGGTTILSLVINDFLGGDAIALIGGGGNVIAGNYLGTDASGAQLSPYPFDPSCTCTQLIMNSGVRIENSSDNLIGGRTAADRNVIVGSVYGIMIRYAASTRNRIEGNYISVDATGNTGLPNSLNIYIENSPSNVIGGTTTGARNVIGPSSGGGVTIAGPGSIANVVQGNYIGTDATGTRSVIPPGFGTVGIYLGSAPGTIIGGSQPGAGNVISGHAEGTAILLYGGDAGFDGHTAYVVQGNRIGTQADGVNPLPNLQGIYVYLASGNAVGGTVLEAGNTIAFNRLSGVFVQSATGNAILSNSIRSNGGLGIDLVPDNSGGDGVTKNDRLDADSGANGLQNYPKLDDATASSVHGSLDSAPNQTFHLQFFRNPACDPSQYGEGATLIGSMNVVTANNGHVNFTASFVAVMAHGEFVSATATDIAGNTSEFSKCSKVD